MGQEIENNIRVLRAEKNWTQQDLADQTGVTRQTIIAVEKKRYTPSLELAFKIARAFNREVEEVFKYE